MLTQLIRYLGTLDYDAVRDVRDVLMWHWHNRAMQQSDDKSAKRHRTARNRVTLRARGRYTTHEGDERGWDYIVGLPHVTHVTDKLDELPTNQLNPLIAAADVLTHALRPRPAQQTTPQGERVARGRWQVKTKTRLATDENGEVILNEEGEPQEIMLHYLYLRVYTSTPDGKSRSASIYIGSLNKTTNVDEFISRVYAGINIEQGLPSDHEHPITRADIVDEFVKGGYEGVKAWRNTINGK